MLTRTMNRSLRDRNLGPEAMYDYDLFAVVCHEGQIDNGHYTCFARSHDEVRPLPSPIPHPPFPVSFRVDCRVLTVLFPSLSLFLSLSPRATPPVASRSHFSQTPVTHAPGAQWYRYDDDKCVLTPLPALLSRPLSRSSCRRFSVRTG